MQLSHDIDERLKSMCSRLKITPRQGLFKSVIVWAIDMAKDQVAYHLFKEEFILVEPLLYKGIGARPVRFGDTVVIVPELKTIDIMLIKREREVEVKNQEQKPRGIFEGKPVKTNIQFYFKDGVYYQGKASMDEAYSEYIIPEQKDYYLGDVWVCVFSANTTQYRYYDFLKDMMGSVETRSQLKHESYYVNVGKEYLTDAANNYQDIVKILAEVALQGFRSVYCPGDGIGVGVMAGKMLNELGYNILVRGSDKYLSKISPVQLDIETQDIDGLYLYVNSYSFCPPMEDKVMIVYDRQTPQMIDRINGRVPRLWYRVRPFLYVSHVSYTSMFHDVVTNYEKERGPMVNSVFFSMNDGSPFDKTRGKEVKVLPLTVQESVAIDGNNSSMVFFKGKYHVVRDKIVLTIGRAPFTSYHYLSMPNDIVDATPYSVTALKFPNKAAMFWSSLEILGYDNYAVQIFSREGGQGYLYYVPLSAERYIMIRYNITVDGKVVTRTALMYVSEVSVMTAWDRHIGEELTGYINGLCVQFVERELRDTNYYILSGKEGYTPEPDLVRRCETFCSKYCDHVGSVT